MRDCSYNVQSIYHLQQISIKIVVSLITGSIVRSATCRYLIYSEADFEVFRPAGATRCTGWGEIWHGGGDQRSPSVPNVTPSGAMVMV